MLSHLLLTPLVCLCLNVLLPISRAQQAGSVDPAFLPGYGVDGSVNALIVQPDNRVLVGGQFDHANGMVRDNLARLNTDGSLDAMFSSIAIDGVYPSSTAYVNALAVQPDGKILVGGNFAQVGGVPRVNLARLNADGSVDAGFVPDLGTTNGVVHYDGTDVRALAVQADGKIVVAGGFDLADGQPHRGIARLNPDGSVDVSFDPATPANVYPAAGLDGDAFALALGPEGDVYVAGSFGSVNGISRPNLARLRGADGHLDPTFAPALGSYPSLSAIACQPDGRLLVAGSFLQPAGPDANTRGDVARFNVDGSPDAEFSMRHANTYFSFSSIQAVAVQPQDGSILVAGSHLYLRGRLTGAVGRYLASGEADRTFYPGLDPLAAGGADPTVSAVAVQSDGTIIAGGNFDTVDGQFRHHLAGLRGSPITDCPVVSATAPVSLAIVEGSSGSPAQSGKFLLQVGGTVAVPLTVNYSVAGKGLMLVDQSVFDTGAATIPAGTRKAKLRVRPLPYASPGPNGKPIKLNVEAGRGYAVGVKDQAKVRVEAQ